MVRKIEIRGKMMNGMKFWGWRGEDGVFFFFLFFYGLMVLWVSWIFFYAGVFLRVRV